MWPHHTTSEARTDPRVNLLMTRSIISRPPSSPTPSFPANCRLTSLLTVQGREGLPQVPQLHCPVVPTCTQMSHVHAHHRVNTVCKNTLCTHTHTHTHHAQTSSHTHACTHAHTYTHTHTHTHTHTLLTSDNIVRVAWTPSHCTADWCVGKQLDQRVEYASILLLAELRSSEAPHTHHT